jgi:hypothetical protein
MKTVQWMLAGILVGIVAVAFLDFEKGRWLSPALPVPDEPDGEEPVLGYDGMDQETAIDWLGDAELDSETIERIIRYEEANRRREPVLSALEDLLG